VADFKQNYFQRRTKDRGPKSNNRINAPEVQVIGSDGDNIGILNTNEAISMAKEQGLDLIEISPNAKPPVCKIIDMGKFKYDAQKKANNAKKKQKIVLLKEIKMRPVTETHDYDFKVKNAKKFIEKGDKVKFTIRFKGRELQHSHLGRELMDKIKIDMQDIGKVELHPKFDGKQMIMVIQPL
jgi:translation initiation factor IF-3